MARKTKEEAQATRSSILNAAEQLFHAQGVSRTSLQDIAAAAGVTRGAIYWHFKDKSDLFNAMLDRVVLPLEKDQATLVNDDNQPTLEALRAQMRHVFAQVSSDERMRRVFEIATHKVEYVDELLAVHARHLQIRHDFLSLLERSLRRGQQRGEVRRGTPPRQLAIGLHALLSGLLHNWMLDPAAFDLRKAGSAAVDAHLRGLAAA